MTTDAVTRLYPKEARPKILDSPLKHYRRSRYVINAPSLRNCSSDLAKYLGCHCDELQPTLLFL